jgi:hypothetical protein
MMIGFKNEERVKFSETVIQFIFSGIHLLRPFFTCRD